MTKEQILTDLYARLTGRKFLTLVGISIVLLLDGYGVVALDYETRSQLLVIAVSYLAVQGGIDGIKAIRAGDPS